MSIQDNLSRVQESIADATLRTGRPAGSVRLVAVSKFHPVDTVLEAVQSGQRLFGENRVQEAEEKFSGVLVHHPDVQLHMIGSLQRNKVAKILPVTSCVQSVDRRELLLEIEKRAALLGKSVDILFEIHTGEESKAGFASEKDLFEAIDLLAECGHTRCSGLMTMAPFTSNETSIRASFRKLVDLQYRCQQEYPALDFSTLSMGMSNDYRIAIEEGSTMVRIGTAIFGERPV